MEDSCLENDLKKLILKTLSLEDMGEDDIKSDMPLFEGGLGLDSIDALELGMAIKKEYGVSFDELGDKKTVFATVKSIADYIAENRGK